MAEKEKVLVVVGPTASGKTATAVALAKALKGEVISADSMQIYKEMDIGTAKPSLEEMEGIPHHLIDCVSPCELYSVAMFEAQALEAIKAIVDRGRTPIIAGGTGLYINGLTMPWSFESPPGNVAIRKALEEQAKSEGPEALFEALVAVDPESADQLHPNNVKRVIRALEIHRVTGRKKSDLDREGQRRELPYDYVMTGIAWDRETLYQRINTRIDMMMDQGLLLEIKGLLEKGYDQALPAMKAIGYKEFFPYLEGRKTLEETLRILKRDTRHFAKRQLTWFRKDDRIRWFDYQQYGDAQTLAGAIAKYYIESQEHIG